MTVNRLVSDLAEAGTPQGLLQLVNILSRSSADSVTTMKRSSPVKDYLYIKQPIEDDFVKALRAGIEHPETIIFLCGSSGDGKSEILARHAQQFKDRYLFHIDATHSYDPRLNAIETIDRVISQHKEEKRPLVMCINIGMLGNYAKEGHLEHNSVRKCIEDFLNSGISSHGHLRFINFEDYQKFSCSEDGSVKAPFIKELFRRITRDSPQNPFWQAYLAEPQRHDEALFVNYRMLQLNSVQDVIIRTLLKAQLRFSLFLTARNILDFAHILLCGIESSSLLHDNLFVGIGTELEQALSLLDPCRRRIKELDIFLIEGSIGERSLSQEQIAMIQHLGINEYFAQGISAQSWVRLFFLLQQEQIGESGLHAFSDTFRESDTYDHYLDAWRLHQYFDSSSIEHKRQLKGLYNDLIIKAIYRYANRQHPASTGKNDRILLHSNSRQALFAPVEIQVSTKQLSDCPQPNKTHCFVAHLRLNVNNHAIDQAVIIDLNLFDLLQRINDGYRPNRHDKNTIVRLEEIVEKVIQRARRSQRLYLIRPDEDDVTFAYDADEGEIHVS